MVRVELEAGLVELVVQMVVVQAVPGLQPQHRYRAAVVPVPDITEEVEELLQPKCILLALVEEVVRRTLIRSEQALPQQ
jgi:hypothetical protein